MLRQFRPALVLVLAFVILFQSRPSFGQVGSGKMPPFVPLPLPISVASMAEVLTGNTMSIPVSGVSSIVASVVNQSIDYRPEGIALHGGNVSTKSWWEALAIILYSDAVMSVENVLIIAILVSGIPQRIRIVATFAGLIAAGGFRIGFASMATLLMKFDVVGILGSIALMFLTLSMFTDTLKQMKKNEPHPVEHHLDFAVVREVLHNMFTQKGFWATADGKALLTVTWAVILQDILLSLDNVLVVAGNAHGDLSLTIIGVALSILMMATIANFMVRVVQQYPITGLLGGLALAKASYNLFNESYEPEAAVVAFGSIVIFLMFSRVYSRLTNPDDDIKPLTIPADETSLTSTEAALTATDAGIHPEVGIDTVSSVCTAAPVSLTDAAGLTSSNIDPELLREFVSLLKRNGDALSRIEKMLETRNGNSG
ncbi:MAG: hypothetical protein HQM09_03955 [Candidatus Riflebacteria bacterium]|nr:hypothetical protein [Candidatus Riflebacteria bacterium]